MTGREALMPLAVDLDGTLIRGDVFADTLMRFLVANPLRVFLFAWWLRKGRPHAKARLASAAPVDPGRLCYNEELVAWLREQRARGRTVVLATASDERAARAVAEHVGLFDDVFASDGETNLKSSRKAERLASAFPEGFVYAGNEMADLTVWARASAAVVVNAPEGLVRRVRASFVIERSFF